MENKQQLLANFLAFKNIPFGEYKTIITTPKAMEFYAKNTPIDQLQSMFVSAGFESPNTINSASNVLKKVYNDLQTVEEVDYSGSYKSDRENQELQKLMQELQGGNGEEDGDDEEGDDDSGGGFFDESGRGGSDIEKALKAFNEALANGEGGDKETTFDELLGRGKANGKSQGQGEGQGQGESQGQGEGEGQGEGQGQGQGEGEGQGQGEGQGEGEGEKESEQNKEGQQKQKDKQKEKQDKQNTSLEAEIQLCSAEIKALNEEKEMLDFISEKNQEQENRVIEIDNIIDDLEFQISNMMGAINADIVLGNDVQFPVNRPPRYISSKMPELVSKIKEESIKRLEDPNYKFPYKIDDKKRRNALISERVMEDVTYFAFEKLKKEDSLNKLYLTKRDIPRILFEMGSDEIPTKVVVESTIEGDTVVIDEAINIDTFIYQLNNLEKDLEIVNKENNIKLIFDTIKNELFNKFII